MATKKRCIILPLVLLFIASPATGLLFKNNVSLFPFHNTNRIRIMPFTDTRYTTNGSSGTLTTASDSAVIFEYTAQHDFSLAVKQVAGIEFDFGNDTLDAACYDYLDIGIEMNNASSFVVSIITGERLSDTTRLPERRYSECVVSLQPHGGIYRCDLGKFYRPYWWRQKVTHTRSLPLPEPDYSRVIAIRVQNDPDRQLLNPARMTIRSIAFSKDRRRAAPFVLYGCIILLLGGIVMVLHCRKPPIVLPPIPQPDPRILTSPGEQKKRLIDEQKKQLVAYINGNYHRSELTVETVAEATRIRIDLIPKYLNEMHHMTFKPYLNMVRITEAKRLLATTDHTITDIAMTVGYENIPNFNRVFKEITGKNPTQYREEIRKSTVKPEEK